MVKLLVVDTAVAGRLVERLIVEQLLPASPCCEKLRYSSRQNETTRPFHSSLACSQEPLTGKSCGPRQRVNVGLPAESTHALQEGQLRGRLEPCGGGFESHVSRTPVRRAPTSPNGKARPALLTKDPYARSKESSYPTHEHPVTISQRYPKSSNYSFESLLIIVKVRVENNCLF